KRFWAPLLRSAYIARTPALMFSLRGRCSRRLVSMSLASARAEVLVEIPQGQAFTRFAERLSEWWPREYSWARDTLVGFTIEPRVGGHCIEHGPNGFRLDWGTVLTWQPPERLSMLWQIGPQRVPEPNPASASTLEVNFVPKPSSKTLVQVEHRGFE